MVISFGMSKLSPSRVSQSTVFRNFGTQARFLWRACAAMSAQSVFPSGSDQAKGVASHYTALWIAVFMRAPARKPIASRINGMRRAASATSRTPALPPLLRTRAQRRRASKHCERQALSAQASMAFAAYLWRRTRDAACQRRKAIPERRRAAREQQRTELARNCLRHSSRIANFPVLACQSREPPR